MGFIPRKGWTENTQMMFCFYNLEMVPIVRTYLVQVSRPDFSFLLGRHISDVNYTRDDVIGFSMVFVPERHWWARFWAVNM